MTNKEGDCRCRDLRSVAEFSNSRSLRGRQQRRPGLLGFFEGGAEGLGELAGVVGASAEIGEALGVCLGVGVLVFGEGVGVVVGLEGDFSLQDRVGDNDGFSIEELAHAGGG